MKVTAAGETSPFVPVGAKGASCDSGEDSPASVPDLALPARRGRSRWRVASASRVWETPVAGPEGDGRCFSSTQGRGLSPR